MRPTAGTWLGLLGAVVPRYYLSKAYLFPREALIFNSIDMAVSAAVYWMFQHENVYPNPVDALGFLIVSRGVGCVAGILSLEPCGKNEVPVLVLLNVASLVGSFCLRFFYDRVRAYPINSSNNQEPSAPPSIPPIVYF